MLRSKVQWWPLGAPLLVALGACSEAGSPSDGTNGPSGSASDEGSVVFDSSRVALLELEVSETDLAVLRADSEQPMGFEDFTYVPARLTYDGTVLVDVGLRVKGNNSRVSAMGDAVPLKIDTNRFVDGQKLDGQTKINLHNNVNQAAKMNEYLSYGALREYGVAAPRTGWAEIVVNGASLGLYTVVEQVGPKLLSRYYEDGKADLYKPEPPAGYLNYSGDTFENYAGVEYQADNDTDHAAFLRMVRVVNDAPVAEWDTAIDVESVLAYFAGNVALGNWDTYVLMGHNYYLFEAAPGRMAMLPWDMNLSQAPATTVCPADLRNIPGGGSMPGGSAPPSAGGPGGPPSGPPDGGGGALVAGGPRSAPLHDRLVADEASLKRYFAHVERFLSGPASEQRLHSRIDEARIALGEHIPDESAAALRETVTRRVASLSEALVNTTACEAVSAP